MNPELEGIGEIQEIRSKTVNYALVAAAFLAVPALIASLLRAVDIGWQNVFYFHIGLVLFVWVTAAFRNQLSYQIRASIVLTLLLALGISDLLFFGLVALGSLLLMAFCIMATSLYGIRGVISSLILSVAVVTAIGWGVQTGAVVFTVDANVYQTGVTNWVLLGVILVFITGIVSSVIAAINHRMVNSINGLRETSEKLRKVQDAEQKAHALLLDAIEALPASFAVYDAEDRLVLFNNRTLEMFPEQAATLKPGVSYEDWVRLNFDKGLIRYDLERKEDSIQEHLREFQALSGVYEVQWNDGRWFEVITRRTADGSKVRLRFDITKRKRYEEQIRSQEGILRTVFDTILHLLFVRDKQRKYLMVNKAWLEYYGEKEENVLGATNEELACFSGEERRTTFSSDQKVLETGGRLDIPEWRLTAPDGRELVFHTIKMALFDENNQIVGLVGMREEITKRVQAEEDLRENQRLLQTVFDRIPHTLIVKDKESRYVKVNKAWCDFYGLSPADVLGKTVMEIPGKPEEDKVDVLNEDQRVLKGKDAALMFEHTRLDQNGNRRHMEAIKSKILDDNGNVVGLVAIALDITKRKRAEDELRASQKLLQTVFEVMPVVVYLKDPEGRYMLVNQTMAAEFQRSPDEFIGRTLDEMGSGTESERAAVARADRQVLSTNRPQRSAEVSFTSPSGEIRIRKVVKVPLRDEEGRAIGIVGVSEDITESKRFEKTLRENQRLLQTVFDAIPHAIFVKDLEGRFIKVNLALGERVNLSCKYMEGRTLVELGMGTEEEVAGQIAMDQEVIKTGKKVESKGILFTFHGGEETWTNVSKVPLRGEDGSVVGVVGISEDITESRKTEEQLRQAQKMEAVGQLAGGVAHYFNNMLQIINGYTELALSREGISDKIAKDLQKVRKGSESAADLTRQLLLFSRQSVLTPRDLDLNDLINNLMKLMDRLLGADLVLQVIAGDGLGNVHGDPGMIEQVLMNLCVNARDAMPEGGRLRIETRKFEVDEAQCKAEGWETPGGYVLITVADDGTGIDKGTLAKIFDPFFTTKEAGKGTGLGLSVVHGIVKQHHGRITVQSELGQGTTLNVFLPVAEGSEAGLAEQTALPVVGGTETILVADDEAGILQLATELLENKGYTVLAASDGEEAVRIFHDHPNEIDLALLDLVMPKLNGRGVYDEIHRLNPELPFIFDSGYVSSNRDRKFFA